MFFRLVEMMLNMLLQNIGTVYRKVVLLESMNKAQIPTSFLNAHAHTHTHACNGTQTQSQTSHSQTSKQL